MRGALVLLLIALASPAAAQEPPGFAVATSGDPVVGRAVELRIERQGGHTDGASAAFRLEVPAWVDVQGPGTWTGEAQATWTLTATREGFWRASLSADEGPVDGCCLYAWSTATRGIASPSADHAIPGELAVGYHPTFRVVEAETAELLVEVSPQDRRFAGQTLAFEAPVGAERDRQPADRAATFAHAFPLRDGQRAEPSAAAFVEVAYEAGAGAGAPHVGEQRVGCARFVVERAGDDVREVHRAGCDAVPAATPSSPRTVPSTGAGAAALALLLAGCAAATPIRRRGGRGRA